jgi:hypothetical protein
MKPRRVPLKRTELRSRTELKRTTRLTSNGPIKAKRRQSPEERASRDLLKKRSGGQCEIQAFGYCTGVGEVWSHRKRRGQSGKVEKWSPTNGLHGCGFCELYLTDHGSDAKVRSLGWTVHPSLDPARVPVWRWGQYVWLLPGGGVEPLDMQEIAEWVGGAA